ncbi:hypothetical protein RRG08_027112 [Elysia crispata]|uniref:Uncharacterized protein n=1 Tax=Elysia crispata TaxID=231223 RepID=A0AAE0YXS0_9GAST|nr:hypothetical protein RRG08_027112 [Elysia crispata]
MLKRLETRGKEKVLKIKRNNFRFTSLCYSNTYLVCDYDMAVSNVLGLPRGRLLWSPRAAVDRVNYASSQIGIHAGGTSFLRISLSGPGHWGVVAGGFLPYTESSCLIGTLKV